MRMLALMPKPVPTPSNMQFYPTAADVGKATYNSCSTPRSASLKRPKLFLDTSRVSSTIGSRSTSLRLETLSVTDPTSRNTFSNAWEADPSASSKPRKPLLTIKSLDTHYSPSSDSSYTYTSTPATDSNTTNSSPTTTSSSPSSISYAATDSSSSSPDYTAQSPYRLPFSTTSILLNGPLPRKRKRTPQPLFPSTKRVSFRAQLTEDIVTKTYILAHSDMDHDIDIDINSTNVPESSLAIRKALARPTSKLSIPIPKTTLEVEVPAAPCEASDDDNDDNEKCPVTPVAGRRKRRREWVWTLGPVAS